MGGWQKSRDGDGAGCQYSRLEYELKDKYIAHLKCEIESCTNQIDSIRHKILKMEHELEGLLEKEPTKEGGDQ